MSNQLSPNFARDEFACHGEHCCGGSAPVVPELVDVLQAARDELGRPLLIFSGFRCITHNRGIGSKDTSQHTLGKAADVQLPAGFTIDAFAAVFERLLDGRGGIGKYNTFIHVDVRDERARWDNRSTPRPH